MREEKDIFRDLADLCQSQGYVHAIASLCSRHNLIKPKGELTGEDLQSLYSGDCLIRGEISVLIGLMVKKEIDYTAPDPRTLQQYIERTDGLLKEMHDALQEPMRESVKQRMKGEPNINPIHQGNILREPFFYGGELAYNFQYRDFSVKKYARDSQWLAKNKGFSIQLARDVAHAVEKFQRMTISDWLLILEIANPEGQTDFQAYMLNTKLIAAHSGLLESDIKTVLDAFTLPHGNRNEKFLSLQDFNEINATPLIRIDSDTFLLLQSYTLMEALYCTPFYWMVQNKNYKNTAMENRGKFAEEFCRERLALVFGDDKVYKNVRILEKSREVGEIDVLVLYGDRAIILQAKSKQLTLKSRKGSDASIRGDFQKAVQPSYDQGLQCAQYLINQEFTLVDANGKEIRPPEKLREIYILCAVSDAYPALDFQAKQFLKYETTELIQCPIVWDIFTLDAVTEMLQSPLYFLSYINRRANYFSRLPTLNEFSILGWHLRKNLWLDDKYSQFIIGEEFSADLDVALMARREGIPEEKTPEGILTRHQETAPIRIVRDIEKAPIPELIDLGLFLLEMGEESILEMNEGINMVIEATKQDGEIHDFSLGVGEAKQGITIHCGKHLTQEALLRLRAHCELRKHSSEATRWFGVFIHPNDTRPKCALILDSKWKENKQMDDLCQKLLSPKIIRHIPPDKGNTPT